MTSFIAGMGLTKLEVRNVRNIESAVLEPSRHINFLVGPNGSGKTSLLEALYILGRGRSFRSNQASQVISFSRDSLVVAGKAAVAGRSGDVSLGVQLARQQREIVLDGRKLLSTAELAKAFPVSLIHPGSSALLDDAPKFRRQFMDWGVFHLEQDYLDLWRGYEKALRQRNALLRESRPKSSSFEAWNRELSRYGVQVAQARENYLERLKPFFLNAVKHFLALDGLVVKPSPGWEVRRSLFEVLQDSVESDRKAGYTQAGPHRGDFAVQIDGKSVRHFFSRGQIRLLVFALLLAQAGLLQTKFGARGCVLIDDLASELDGENRVKLLSYIGNLQGQFFVTATDEGVRDCVAFDAVALFHVERGQLTRLEN